MVMYFILTYTEYPPRGKFLLLDCILSCTPVGKSDGVDERCYEKQAFSRKCRPKVRTAKTVVSSMAKAFGYERGAFNYFTGSLTGNPVAMYIYGAGLLALWNAYVEVIAGSFIMASIDYFFTKYLPPSSVEQVVVQLLLGAVVASVKWYVFTPRQGPRAQRGF